MERNMRSVDEMARLAELEYAHEFGLKRVMCMTQLDPYRRTIRYWVMPGCGNCGVCLPDEANNPKCSQYRPIVVYGVYVDGKE